MAKITMTQEQKLLKLLQVAVENGWKSPLTTSFEKCKIRAMKKTPLAYEVDPFESDEMWIFIHLNDLVTNWEEGEVGFIEALCKRHVYKSLKGFYQINNFDEPIKENATIRDLLVTQWILQPTFKRLDWLLETFKHLIHE